ncbi:MAG: beta strand repeat-containing protein, partial [Limisphaerales bacterium]
TVTSTTITSSGAAAAATVAGSPYTIIPSAATGTGLSNYTVTYANGTLAVSAAALTVTATNRSKIYGQTVTFAGTEFATSGLLNSDTVTSTTITSSGAAAAATVAGSPYTIIPSAATGTGLGNYTIAYANGSLTVNAATLTVTATNRGKTYGQTVTFAGTEFTTSGLLNSDTVTSATITSAGAVATATVAGSPYSIIPSAATGTGLGNYTIAYVNGSLAVSAAALTVTATNRGKTYGQTVTFAGTEFTTSGLLNSDAVTSATITSLGAAATATVAGSPYTIIPSAAAGTGLGNYTVTYANGMLTVSAAALTVTATNRGKTYGQTVTFAGTEFTTSGLLNSDTVTSATITSAGAAATATVAGSPYTIVPSAAAGTGLGNYTIAYANGTLTVSAAALTVTATNRSKTYGQTVTFAGTEFTTSGLLNSDTVTSATITSSGAAATATVAGSPYTITPSAAPGTGLGNYTIAYVNGSLAVSAAALTVTATNRSKTYGQTVTFAGTEFTTSGLHNSDTVTSASLSCSGAAATATVAGSPYSIVLSAAVGSGLGNYTIAYASGLLTVSPAVLTVTANNRSKTYGQTVTFAGTEFTSSGLFNSDTVSSVSLNSAGAAASATVTGSPYPIIPSAAVGAGLGNYTIAYANGILTVAEAAPAIIWANPAPIIYGAALTSSQLDATTTVPGSFAYSPGNGSVLSAGTNTLSAIFTPSDTADYSSATNTVSLVVSNAALTVTAASLSRPYGAANPVLTGTISGVTNGDNITAAYSTAATSSSPPGTYSIAPSLVDPNDRETNYTVRLVDGTLTVGQATPALVWTNPVSILYGTALASSQLNATANAGGSFAYSPGIGAVLNTGTNLLSVIFTPTDTVDYSSAGATVSLVVLPAPLTVTASSFSRPYETANPVFTGTIAGLTNNDNITAAYSCSATVNSPVGSYPIVPSLVDPNDRETNYSVSLVNGILLVGHPAEVLTWTNPAPIAYGAALASSQLDATATVPGSFAYTPTNGSVLNTGSNALTVIFTPADTVDYTSVTDTVSLVVLPAPLTVTAANTNRTYGQANPPFTTILMGVTNGDTITATASCGATSSSAVGAYPIVPGTPVGNDLTNYTITYASGVLTINPAALTITANNRSKTYGQAVTLAGTEFATSGLLNSDTVSGATLNSSGAAATATVAGSPYSIVLGGAVGSGLGNYTITYASGLLTVNPATLTVTANNRGKTYGQGVTFAGTEFTTSGLLNSDTVSSATLTSSGALATAAVAGSPYTIVPSAAVGTGLGNYTISYASGALTISPAALTVTANNRSKTYGQTVSFAGTEFTASGLLNSDTMTSATLTSSGAAASATVAGSPYSIVPSAAVGTGLGNYTITCVNGALTITPAALAITADNRSKNFGQTVTFAGTEFVANGLLDGDTVTSVTLTSAGAAATATVADSPYPIIPGAAVGTGLGNYTLAYVNGVLTVTSNATIPPVIQSVQQSGNSVVFTWSTTADLAYQVQYTTNLNQSVWANLGSPITAIGSTATASDYLTNAQTFYRIVALP